MLPSFGAIVVVFVGLVLAGRWIVWWYLGIDKQLAMLADIAASLRTLPTVREYDQHFGRKPPRAA